MIALAPFAAALSLHLAAGPAAPPRQVDLHTPSGAVFRVFEVHPSRAAGAGLQVSYAAETADPARLARDADAVAAAVGPELAAASEVRLTVRAAGRAGAVEHVYEPAGAGFRRAKGAPQAEARLTPHPAAGAAADRADRARTAAAAAAGKAWVLLLDDGRPEAAIATAAASFRSEIQATSQWAQLMGVRKALRYPATRTERYRTQSRDASGAWVIATQYETRGPDGVRFLERVTLVEEGGAWKVGGYGIRPVLGP
ncbi:MAG: DUF4019 domain-containing protein [Anaeromyxobacteraceae bacterium]